MTVITFFSAKSRNGEPFWHTFSSVQVKPDKYTKKGTNEDACSDGYDEVLGKKTAKVMAVLVEVD